MTSYILAIDGGGTKTVGVLYDFDGREIKRSLSGFANFSVNAEKTINHLYTVMDDLYCEGIAYIQIGIAGYTNYKNKDQLIKDIKTRYTCPVSIATDAEIAFYALKKNDNHPLVLVLAGTGSVLMYQGSDHIKMIGGFGHILGDEGSAYHLAISALKKMIEAYEEGQHISTLSQAILEEIKADTYQDIKTFVYNHDKSHIAKLSTFIADFAYKGNQEAIDLFVQEGELLAKQTLKAIKDLKVTENIRIGFKGGFLLKAPYVKETLLKRLEEEKVSFTYDASASEPVVGAYYLAKRHLDKR